MISTTVSSRCISFDYSTYFIGEGGVSGRYANHGYMIEATGIGNRGR